MGGPLYARARIQRTYVRWQCFSARGLHIDPSKYYQHSVKYLETAAAWELYGAPQPLKLPTVKSGLLKGIFHENALFQAIKQFILTVKGPTDVDVLVHLENTISDVKLMMGEVSKGPLEGEQLVFMGNVLQDDASM